MPVNEILVSMVSSFADDTKPDDILATLNEKTIIEKTDELQTYKYMAVIYGPEFTATVLGKLKAAAASNPLLDATYFAMCSTGLDFSRDLTQTMLEQLRGVLFSDDEVDKMKWMGVQKYSVLDKAGLSSITSEEISAAHSAYKSRRDNLAWFTGLFNTIMPQLQDGTITRDEIKAMVNA